MIEEVAPQLTARRITNGLWFDLSSGSRLVVPRYTPQKWWECDVWRLTKAGFVDEYEIKLTVADFKKDFEKTSSGSLVIGTGFPFRITNSEVKRKHDLIAAGDSTGPNRFWFIAPSDVLPKVTIPEYAGVMEAFTSNRHPDGRAFFRLIRKAPWLHKQKWDGDPVKVRDVFYWRFWNAEVRR